MSDNGATKVLKMNNVRLQRILISVSLVTQVFGFATLGSLMALRGGPDGGARIGGLLAVLTGTMFLVAAIVGDHHVGEWQGKAI
jgi:hypothetical protein